MFPGSAGSIKGVGSTRLYNTGSMTIPDHPMIADWGHSNVRNFFIRNLFNVLIFSKLGLGLQFGASASSFVTSS